ncbi:tetratricopeptide repeat protein [Chryseolinea sp. H1M3-3]|uniref:tetratricopeptide repeat protein n=1 Tax=Chryseolinea sp. H1M3-3 TaxID=3034144 RepID=UPI0023ED9F96|nr:tetratricopeptide repeat protein [Chryseolinea sp. H1M3-3]
MQIIKKIIAAILLFAAGFTETTAQTTQTYNVDSLINILSGKLNDTSRIWALNNLGRNIQNSDTTLVLAEQAIKLSRKISFKKGEAEAYNNVGYWFNQRGNYPKALESYLHAIQLAESFQYDAGLMRSYNSIATVYLYLKNYNTAVEYSRKARQLSMKYKDLNLQTLSASWLSKAFLELNRTDSALKYAQESYEIARTLNEPLPLYFATARLGEIHASEGNYPLALEYLRLSLRNGKRDGRYFRIAAAHQQLAEVFKKMGELDSCLSHAQKTFDISQRANLSATLFNSSLLLSELFEGKQDKESLRYHKLALAAQDSLFSQEKNQQIQALSFGEALRQQEIESLKMIEKTERRNNIQYGAIALSLVLFLIVFLLLSHSIFASPQLIRFLGVLALLILFEFINLLLGPFISGITDNVPFLMLIIMVCIAGLLIPIHSRLENIITGRLVEKNKRLRLAAAKKMMESVGVDQQENPKIAKP